MAIIKLKPGCDDLKAHREAAAVMRAEPDSRLIISPGEYILYDRDAAKLRSDVMTGKLGANPEGIMFRPDFKYSIGVDFTGIKGATVIGDGARILSDGFMETFSLNECSDITIRGLEFDLTRRAFTVCKIISADSDHTVVKVDQWDEFINPSMPASRIIISDPETGRICRITGGSVSDIPEKGVLVMSPSVGEEFVGYNFIIVHGFHFRPMILIHRAENITLEGITIYSNCGMGIVGHRSRNIYMHSMKIIPAGGLGKGLLSTNTDATHFTSCEGVIDFENCVFEGS